MNRGLVYFIGCHKIGTVKIGYSADDDTFKKRIASHQVSFPNKLEIFGIIKFSTEAKAREAESKFHAAMRYYNTNGEWFRIEGACRVLLDEVVSGINENLECNQYELAMVSAILEGKKARVKPENSKDDLIELLSYICLVQAEQINTMNTAHRILAEQFSKFDCMMTNATITRTSHNARKVGYAVSRVMTHIEDGMLLEMDFDEIRRQANMSDDEIVSVTLAKAPE
jgi:hypothetical protein